MFLHLYVPFVDRGAAATLVITNSAVTITDDHAHASWRRRWTRAERADAAVQVRASETQTEPRYDHVSETPPLLTPKLTGYDTG